MSDCIVVVIVFGWFRSYLTGRVQCFQRGMRKWKLTTMLNGVPQGSVAFRCIYRLLDWAHRRIRSSPTPLCQRYANSEIQGSCPPDSAISLSFSYLPASMMFPAALCRNSTGQLVTIGIRFNDLYIAFESIYCKISLVAEFTAK